MIGGPAGTTSGPSSGRAAASARNRTARYDRSPRSRTHVTPASSSCRAAERTSSSSVSSSTASRCPAGSALASKTKCVCASMKPGSNVAPAKSMSWAPAGGAAPVRSMSAMRSPPTSTRGRSCRRRPSNMRAARIASMTLSSPRTSARESQRGPRLRPTHSATHGQAETEPMTRGTCPAQACALRAVLLGPRSVRPAGTPRTRWRARRRRERALL